MDLFDFARLIEFFEHYGVPALIAVPTFWLLWWHTSRERKRGDDVDCPPWAKHMKTHLKECMDQRVDRLERHIDDKLDDHAEDARTRDGRQTRIEGLLYEIRGMIGRGRSGQ